ncbi:MAG: CoA-binding protein [Deltaproteobacteria bacterium]|nr:CoA-binding protein [Deltaproteobacteria bacterium]
MAYKFLFDMGFWRGYYTGLDRDFGPYTDAGKIFRQNCWEKKMNLQNQMSEMLRTLKNIFYPENVAVIGASTTFGKWGQVIFSNIRAGGFKGKVFPVNSKGGKMFGLDVFPSITDISDRVDLAFITTPAESVPGLLEELGEKGVKGAVIITSGFSETDVSGKRLERKIVEVARKNNVWIIGPNTMGIICPYSDFFATGSHPRPQKGSVGFISQSGNLGNQLVHWAEQQGVGISLFVGSGNEAMLTCPDYMEYLENDPNTRFIVLYVENVGDGSRFMKVAERINRKKPVILLKGGSTTAGKRAAASHTGAMSGEDAVFKGACHQVGILNVNVPSDLLNLSAGFSSLPLPMGNRVGIVTLGGGWGVVTADECIKKGLVIPEIPEDIVARIGEYLPEFWSKGNPVDLVGTRNLEAPVVAVRELMKWDGIDAVICLGIVGRHELVKQILDSTRKVDPEVSSEFLAYVEKMGREFEERFIAQMAAFMETYQKPVIGVSMADGGRGTVRPVPGSRYSGVMYQTPETAVNVLAQMVSYSRFLSKTSVH